MRVVIAEDNALLRDGLELLLTHSGHEVTAAVDNAPALCPVSVFVHRCRVSSTCICGRFRRSKARCTLTRALARAA